MPVEIIAILVVVLIFFTVAMAYGNSTLDKVQQLPGEETLLEEKGIRVEQAGAPKTVLFINCLVRVTSARIIIAQKVPFRKMHVLRHIIHYGEFTEKTDLGTSLKKGFLTFRINKSHIRISSNSEGTTIRIDIPESTLTRGQYITYTTSQGSQYSQLFG